MAEQILPSSGADPQDYYYLNYSMPGSLSRRMYQERTCNPLWPTFGCKTDPVVIGDQFVPSQTSMPDYNPMEPTQFTKDTNPFFWNWETIFSQMPIMNAEDNPEGADMGQTGDAGGDADGQNFGQDQGGQDQQLLDDGEVGFNMSRQTAMVLVPVGLGVSYFLVKNLRKKIKP